MITSLAECSKLDEEIVLFCVKEYVDNFFNISKIYDTRRSHKIDLHTDRSQFRIEQRNEQLTIQENIKSNLNLPLGFKFTLFFSIKGQYVDGKFIVKLETDKSNSTLYNVYRGFDVPLVMFNYNIDISDQVNTYFDEVTKQLNEILQKYCGKENVDSITGKLDKIKFNGEVIFRF